MNWLNRFTCTPGQLGGMIQTLHRANTPPIIDYIQEKPGYRNYEELKDKITKYPGNHFAVKLSSFGVRTSQNRCLEQVEALIERAKQNGSVVYIDAEQHDIQDRISALTDYFMETYNQDKVVVYKTYQMYKKSMPLELREDLCGARSYALGVKLVRGAYLREDRHHGVLCESEEKTHKQYNQGIADFAIQHRKGDQLLCATHNVRSTFVAKHYIREHKVNNIAFAQLLGMGDALTDDLEKAGHNVYKYLPYGQLHESIPYLLRRLYENYPMMQHVLR
jgi:proline dehydrogenase